MTSTSLRALSYVAAALTMLSVLSSPASAQEAVVVKEFDVFVDLPTAFAFIKLPSGWKFVGKLDAEQLRHLPPGTVTSLLRQEDESDIRVAAKSRPAVVRAKS